MARIGTCFVQLVPAIIASGLIGILLTLTDAAFVQPLLGSALAALHAHAVLALLSGAATAFLVIQVAMNAASEFGGSASVGGAVGAVTLSPALASLHLDTIGVALHPGQGGLVAGLCAGMLSAAIERGTTRLLPGAIANLLAPTAAVLITGTALLLAIMPLSGIAVGAIERGTAGAIEQGGALIAFVLGAGFIFLHLIGLNQALIPLHLQLIAHNGFSTLFPILAMAGGGQTGAGLALYLCTSDAPSLRLLRGSLLTCVLGVGEPLLFGALLPLGWPLLTASAGAGTGAIVLGYAAAHGETVGARSIGAANLLLTPFITGPHPAADIGLYVLALSIATATGFILTWPFARRAAKQAPLVLPTPETP